MLFRLRVLEPDLPRPFRAKGYPFTPALALFIASGSTLAMAWYQPTLVLVFVALLAVAVVGYFLRRLA